MYKLNEPENWGDTLTQRFLSLWFTREYAMLKTFVLVETSKREKDTRLTSYAILSELYFNMSRKPKENADAIRNRPTGNSKPSTGGKLVWANINLTSEDKANLAQSDLSFEYLAAYVTSLADVGWGVTVKRKDDGITYSCTIIGSHPVRSGVSIGISSFGGSLRNALLSCVYKYCDVLGETLDDIDNYTGDVDKTVDFG